MKVCKKGCPIQKIGQQRGVSQPWTVSGEREGKGGRAEWKESFTFFFFLLKHLLVSVQPAARIRPVSFFYNFKKNAILGLWFFPV